MNELIDEVHRLGMKFGLWIEPEMVNPKSRLFSKHPEWVLSYPNREILMGRNQYELDMANPEVVDYLIQVLDELLSENAIDYIKWDMNRYLSEAGSPTREPRQWKELHFRSTEGVYRLAEELKKRHPEVELEAWRFWRRPGGLRRAGAFRRVLAQRQHRSARPAFHPGSLQLFLSRQIHAGLAHR